MPFADTSTYPVPEGAVDEEILMLADILPTAYEVGVLNGHVQPGDTVAIVGAGPIGLAAITGSKLYSPGTVIAIDLADSRLDMAKQFGADLTINDGDHDTRALIREATGGLGVDVAIEAVGIPSGSPPRSTSSPCGPATSPSPRDWSTPPRPRRCSGC